MTVKTVKYTWIDEELKNGIMKREAKEMANRSGCITDWQMYCKLRHHLTKLNKKKKLHNEPKINDMKNETYCSMKVYI
jgi:hypothetical protein